MEFSEPFLWDVSIINFEIFSSSCADNRATGLFDAYTSTECYVIGKSRSSLAMGELFPSCISSDWNGSCSVLSACCLRSYAFHSYMYSSYLDESNEYDFSDLLS
mmetsp:Transcript_8148/g.12091  ORF Transcript_8148/g.12091 Transcript_8148/m.12091 type:complete len:104 (+) Transcript_8148:1256-1567(+)